MTQEKILGAQLNIQNVSLDISTDALAIANIESAVNHNNILNVGANTHVQIDSHIADITLHFSTLDGLSDVNVTTPVAGEILTYSASPAGWFALPPPPAGVTNPMTADLNTGGYSIITSATSDGTTNADNIVITTGGTTGPGISGNGGNILITGGASQYSQSGEITIAGGNGYIGGAVSISAGSTVGDPPSLTPDVNITAQDGNYSGNVNIAAGYSVLNPGGNITLTHGGSGVDGNANQGAVAIKNSKTTNSAIVRLYTNVNYVEVSSPALAGNVDFVLPNSTGTSGDVLTTNGIGATSWQSLSKINPQIVSEYTLQLSDINTMVTMAASGSPVTNIVNIPSSITTNFPIGAKIKVNQLGVGTTNVQISITGSPADILYVVGGAATANLIQHQTATLTKISATEWNVSLSSQTP